jgi:hypothetical protein
LTTSSSESATNAAGQFDSQSTLELNTGINATYATASSGLASGAAIQTSSEQQTREYLSKTATGIYNDPNPQILRRAATGAPITYQQNIRVRFLQPPALPPPGVIFKKKLNNHIYLFYFSHLLLKKYVHHNRLHLHRLSYVNVHHPFHHHLHLFYASVHQYLQQLLLVKQVKRKTNLNNSIDYFYFILSNSPFASFTSSTTISHYRTSSTSSTQTT